MAEIDKQKHLVDLIGDLTSERSLRVGRVAVLKKRIDAVESGLEAADAAEEDLKKVETSLNSATIIQPPEPRNVLYKKKKIALLQDEISCLDNELYALENKERLLRGRFIRKKIELNKKEREFEKTMAFSLGNDGGIGVTATYVKVFEDGKGADQETTKDMVSDISSQKQKEQQLTQNLLGFKKQTENLKHHVHDLMQEKNVMMKKNADLQKQLEDQKRRMELANTKWKTERDYTSGRKESLERQNQALSSALRNFKQISMDVINERVSWNEEKEKLIKDKDSAKEKNQLLGGARDNLLTDSPLKKMVHVLPNWMKAILAPKEQITGEELGVFMGALVTITSYIVTFSNKDLKVTALGAFAALLGIIIGKSFNNMVTYISMDKKAGFKTSLSKAANSLPWIFLGGVIPIAVGGFISAWKIRVIVTSLVALALKIAFAYVWSSSYDTPAKKASFVVLFGVIGISLAAGMPHFLAKIGT